MVHATVDQLTAWTGAAAPADAERLLRRASELIDARVTAWYPTSGGAAVAAAILDALADATCAQVEFWMAGGGEQDDILGPAASTTVGPLHLEESHADRLAPRAADRLRRAGLLTAAVGPYPMLSGVVW